MIDCTAFAGLDPDIRTALLAQIRDIWTHGSTAIEGNTLTLGETNPRDVPTLGDRGA